MSKLKFITRRKTAIVAVAIVLSMVGIAYTYENYSDSTHFSENGLGIIALENKINRVKWYLDVADRGVSEGHNGSFAICRHVSDNSGLGGGPHKIALAIKRDGDIYLDGTVYVRGCNDRHYAVRNFRF